MFNKNINECGIPYYIVHMMRGGAPDKANLKSNVSLIKHNNKNLRDFSLKEIKSIAKQGHYILPSDEGDIIYANKLREKDQSFILLPQTKNGKIIDYKSFVEKDSEVYSNLSYYTPFKYKKFEKYSIEDFKILLHNQSPLSDFVFKEKAIKTTTGSGSRGVFVCSKEAFDKGWFNYHEYATLDDMYKILDFARSEKSQGHDCSIIVQDLIPVNYDKVNVDFVIRDGELLGYKWGIPEPGSNFTNWNWCKIIRNEATEDIMNSLSRYLIDKCGVYNAIMNFEAYSNPDDTRDIYMVEFNWRYSNSTFESLAFNTDFIKCYLENIKFGMPYGSTNVCRSWQAIKQEDINCFI